MEALRLFIIILLGMLGSYWLGEAVGKAGGSKWSAAILGGILFLLVFNLLR